MRYYDRMFFTNEMVKDGIFERAQFIWFSEPGAMGPSGEIMFLTDDGRFFNGNYISGNLDLSLILTEFPYFKDDCIQAMFDEGISDDNEIHYFYLECGNHLFIRQNVYEFFIDLVDIEQYIDFRWIDAAQRICPDAIRRAQLDAIIFYCDQLGMEKPECYPFGSDEEIDEFLACWREYDPCPDLK